MLSLEGLSIGDAFGQMFFGKTDLMLAMIGHRALPASPWFITDDSIMAIGLVETLQEKGHVDQDLLAQRFAENYEINPNRGYGGMAHRILLSIGQGMDWREVAPAVFDGSGSYGNGGAMRVAPLGGYFADASEESSEESVIERLIHEARHSAEVTHSHIEGQAGAIAVALAAYWAWTHRQDKHPEHRAKGAEQGKSMLAFVRDRLPDTETQAGIHNAYKLPFSYSVETAVSALGNGTRLSAQDTVPFALWCAGRHINSFEDALWATVQGLGDRDTTCAIVGGVVALSVGYAGIPAEWQKSRETLNDWKSRGSASCD